MRHFTTAFMVGAMTVVGCVAPGAKPPLEDNQVPDPCALSCSDGGGWMQPEADGAITRDAATSHDAAVHVDTDAAIDPPDASGAVDPDATVTPRDASVTCNGGYATGASRCVVTETSAQCTHNEHTIGGRLIYSQTPIGQAPDAGWPTVVIYQGSIYGPTVTWSGDATMPFGGLNQIKLQAMLLDNGFMVTAPSADGIAWNTNFPGYEISSDSRFIPLLIEEIEKGTFGPADMTRLYATGISSGGYMTSRMAVSYAGTFRALAIESGSYATCSNNACLIPSPLPTDHPPTLFLHGQNDIAVPIGTAMAYKAQLDSQGIETAMVIDPMVGHQWLKVAPEEITCWFLTH